MAYTDKKVLVNETFNFTTETDELTGENCMHGIEIVDKTHAYSPPKYPLHCRGTSEAKGMKDPILP